MLSSYTVRLLTTLVPVAVLAAAAQAEPLVPIASDRVTSVSISSSPNAITVGNQAPMHIGMWLAGYNKKAADKFIADANTPGTPEYHHWLQGNQFAQRFGPSAGNIGSTINWMTQQGFTNVKLDDTGLFVTGDAPTSTVEKAFSVSIGTFARPASEMINATNSTFYSPTSDPLLPASLASKVTGIYGLSSHLIPVAHNSGIIASSNISSFLTPIQISSAYGLNILQLEGYQGDGQTVCVISPTKWTNTDPGKFAAAFGITGWTLLETKVDGGPPTGVGASNGAPEAALDSEMIIGMAHHSTVNMIECPGGTYQQWFDMYSKCAALNPAVVSSSWGLPEVLNTFPTTSNGLAAAYDATFAAIAAKGIPFFNASGDSGAFTSEGAPAANVVDSGFENGVYTVTSVGGTQLVASGNNWIETPWTYTTANGGSGGGEDHIKSRPSWQTGPHVVNADSNGFRQFPDISAVGSPFSGVEVFVKGVAGGIAGTSVAAPLSAGSFAVLTQIYGQRVGNPNPALYKLGGLESLSGTYTGTHYLYNDMLGGTNGLQPSAPDQAIYNNLAWDYVTGFGSIDYSKMLYDLGWQLGFTGYGPDFLFSVPTGWSRAMDFTTDASTPAADTAVFTHGNTLYVSVGYHNGGNSDSLPMNIGVFYDNVLKVTHQVKAMTPDMRQSYVNVCTIPNLAVGTHTIRCVLNYGTTIPEASLANNNYSRTIVVH